MPVMRGSSTITAGTITENVLQGLDFEFVPVDALVSVALSQESGAGTLSVDVKADSESLGAGLRPNNAVAASRVIRRDDTLIDQEFVPAGTRLKIRAEETGGSSDTDLNFDVLVEPIP